LQPAKKDDASIIANNNVPEKNALRMVRFFKFTKIILGSLRQRYIYMEAKKNSSEVRKRTWLEIVDDVAASKFGANRRQRKR
jgi:hypothetical protein